MEQNQKPVTGQPEVILTSKDMQLFQAVEQGERPCPNPNCGLPLRGEALIIPGVYEGIVLYCPKEQNGCGFREL